MKSGRFLGAVALLAALLPAFPAAGQEGEDLPRIFLEKKVYSDVTGGKRSFFESHTVEKGESLWKILERKEPLTPDRYTQRLKEFLRANPEVVNPSRITPGQELLIPSGKAEEPATVPGADGYLVRKGDTLLSILASRDVPRSERKKYLEAIKEINPSITDVDRIRAGKTVLIPMEEYFGEGKTAVASAEPAASGETAPPSTSGEPSRVPGPGEETLAAGKPGAQLLSPAAPVPDASVVETGKQEPTADTITPPARTPYRGLLSDLFLALGEKWVDRGTLYLPLPSGSDVVVQLKDFPIVRFSTGVEALIDFRGGIPPRFRDGIASAWKSIRVVSFADAAGSAGMIDRVLGVSGYHSVKEGISRPVVMGETVSVALPARWIIQRTEDSLLSGDIVLVKEVPEKPGPDLMAVLRYARRLGLRVLPYADDPAAMEGFLVGLGDEPAPVGIPVALTVPAAGGLPAVDFGLDLLGIQGTTGERIRVGGKADGFQLVIEPERLFDAGGKKYLVDTGKISPGVRSILRQSGYGIFPAGKDDSGREIFRRLMKAAGTRLEERKEYLLAGGEKAGYEVRVTGSFLTLAGGPDGTGRTVVLVRRKVHSATRILLRDLGVEIVDW